MEKYILNCAKAVQFTRMCASKHIINQKIFKNGKGQLVNKEKEKKSNRIT